MKCKDCLNFIDEEEFKEKGLCEDCKEKRMSNWIDDNRIELMTRFASNNSAYDDFELKQCMESGVLED